MSNNLFAPALTNEIPRAKTPALCINDYYIALSRRVVGEQLFDGNGGECYPRRRNCNHNSRLPHQRMMKLIPSRISGPSWPASLNARYCCGNVEYLGK